MPDIKRPDTAMVFAAGFGTRMRPLTNDIPKPLVKVAGKTLLDYSLDALAAHRVARAVVNTHYLPDLIWKYLERRKTPEIFISHESPVILETGGGIVHALPLLGKKPFYVTNTDTFWIDKDKPALQRLAENWDPEKMDMLLLLSDIESAIGYDGKGDFNLMPDGILKRNKTGNGYKYAYSGLMIVNPEIFSGRKEEPFSIFGNFIFKEEKYNSANGSMPRIYGVVHNGTWLHVGTPDAIKLAEDAISSANIINQHQQ